MGTSVALTETEKVLNQINEYFNSLDQTENMKKSKEVKIKWEKI